MRKNKRTKLLYVFFVLIVINILINGLITFVNLVLAGIVLALFAGKEKTGDFSLWKLFVGIGIVSCSVLVGALKISGLTKL